MEWLNYWWLIFPLMGIAGGAAKAWERGARARHKRRLEVMRAKAELTGAKAEARRKPLAAQVTDAVDAGLGRTAEAPRRTQLQKLFAAHDEVTARWLEYELDVAKLIAFPAMSDGRQPLTAAFLRAKKVADRLRPESATAKVDPADLAEYRNAVTDYEVAFDVAERDARRVKDSSFTPEERRRLETAQKLLTVAVDEAATPAERQLAYKRVREELDGLLSISDDAIEVLKKKVSLELTTGPVTTASAPASASATPPVSATPPAPASAPGSSSRPEPAAPSGSPSAPAREPKTGPWPVPQRDQPAPGRITRPKPLP